MVDVYHELAFPYEVPSSILRALKPGGQLVSVESRASSIPAHGSPAAAARTTPWRPLHAHPDDRRHRPDRP